MLKTYSRIIGYSLALLFLLSGCSIQKRQYQPGLYFSWYGKSYTSTQLRSTHKNQSQLLLDSSIHIKAKACIIKKGDSTKMEALLLAPISLDKKITDQTSVCYELKKVLTKDERPPRPKKKKMPKHLTLIVFGAISLGVAGLLYGMFLPVAGLVALGLGLSLVIIGAINSPKRVDKRLANESTAQKPEYSDGERAVIFGAVSAAAILLVSLFILGVVLILEILMGFN